MSKGINQTLTIDATKSTTESIASGKVSSLFVHMDGTASSATSFGDTSIKVKHRGITIADCKVVDFVNLNNALGGYAKNELSTTLPEAYFEIPFNIQGDNNVIEVENNELVIQIGTTSNLTAGTIKIAPEYNESGRQKYLPSISSEDYTRNGISSLPNSYENIRLLYGNYDENLISFEVKQGTDTIVDLEIELLKARTNLKYKLESENTSFFIIDFKEFNIVSESATFRIDTSASSDLRLITYREQKKNVKVVDNSRSLLASNTPISARITPTAL
jgi:hypothetical protein